ncbi:MAG: hypothetical protein LC800_07435 [Acidobacteria bacterium]|nr:hypothetical protein [Acidobacteriota bacterium]
MPSPSLERLLDRLDELKRPADARGRAELARTLRRVARRRFRDAEPLIRFHETLLFMRAYPQGAALLRETEKLLKSFGARVARLSESGADTSALEAVEVSGIAGTGLYAVFGYDIVRWLARAHAGRVRLAWDDGEERAHLTALLPRFLPLFEEDAYVDAKIPFREWLRAARRRGESDLQWIVRQFDSLPLPERERAELFDPLKLWVRWELGETKAARTHTRRAVREIFYHRGPLLGRRDVDLARELDAPPMPVERLARAAAGRVLAEGRDTMAVRFRELHGFTHGDPRTVVRADAGRGLEIFLWGVAPPRRLPLLAYHAGVFFKNGIPAGYHEGLSAFGRTEIGLNLFYTFREGESAWTYARLMRLYRQLLGTDTFSVEPYQLGGSGNSEGVASGAFWFYRKLGFRPVRPEIARLVAAEERRIGARAGYRTPPATLRRLAAGHVIYEARDAPSPGAWDHFHVRRIGLAVQRRMSREFGGDARRIRAASLAEVTRALRTGREKFNDAERHALSNFALALALVPDLARWTPDERRALVRVVRAKAGPDETRYLRLLRRHARLRRAIIALGTNRGG